MLESQIASLNEEQRQVATCETHCLAIAAPGSGKTKTLAVKAALNLSRGRTVTAVTFTRDAATELRDRIIAIAGKEHLPNLLVGTFHSIDMLMAFPQMPRSGMGRAILQKSRSKLKSKWEIIREGPRRSYVTRSIEESGLELDIEKATAIIEALKSEFRLPETENEARLVKTYQGLLKRHGVIDFQDILIETNRALDEGLITPLATDQLMIDEFQDTDALQYAWAMHHARTGAVVTAVGDDDQSIYGFRRALGYAGMSQFKEELQATRVVLGTNYRSHREVLEPAERLIACNTERMPKLLVSQKGSGGSALWDTHGSRAEEAEACVEWVAKALEDQSTVGVLSRTNRRLDEIEAMCLKKKVPYVRSDGGSILNTQEMSVVMAAVGVLVEDSALDLDHLLGWAGCSEEELESLRKQLGANGPSSLTKAMLDKASLSASSKKLISELARLIAAWIVILDTGGIAFVATAIQDFLVSYAPNTRAKHFLPVVVQAFAKPLPKKGAVDLMRQRLQDLRSRRDQSKDDLQLSASVALLTAHGSKGLEWDCVWMVGCEDGTFPDESASLQEERRLFFVAMTRARKSLVVSAAGAKPSSPFIPEAGLARVPKNEMVAQPGVG